MPPFCAIELSKHLDTLRKGLHYNPRVAVSIQQFAVESKLQVSTRIVLFSGLPENNAVMGIGADCSPLFR
jgi:hypothetical protein